MSGADSILSEFARGGGPSRSDGGLRPPPLHHPAAGPPPPDEPGEEFARLAGLAGLVFGWTPETFWNATPAELAALVRAAAGERVAPPAPNDIARLMERFPDG